MPENKQEPENKPENDSGENTKKEDINKNITEGLKAADEEDYRLIIKNKKYNKTVFAQLIMENIINLTHVYPDYLSNAELALLFKLISITEKYSNRLVKVERKSNYGYKLTKRPATITWIAEFFKYSSRSYLSKQIQTLKDKGFLFKEKIDSNTHHLYLSPEISYRGKKNALFPKLCDMLNNEQNDILDDKKIALPWKAMKKRNKKLGKLYKRSVYLKEKNKYKDNEKGMLDIDIKELQLAANERKVYLENINKKANNFIDQFMKCLKLDLKDDNNNKADITQTINTIKKINNTKKLKDRYINYLELLYDAYFYKHHENNIPGRVIEKKFLNIIYDFFEKLYALSTLPSKEIFEYEIQECDHIKYLVHELFVYTTMFLLTRKQYKLVSNILSSEFYIKSKEGITTFFYPIFSFNHAPENFAITSFSPDYCNNVEVWQQKILQLFIKRLKAKYKQRSVVEIDLLLYYLSEIYHKQSSIRWLPRIYLSVYKNSVVEINELFLSSILEMKFEEIKPLFQIDSYEGLKEHIINFEGIYNGAIPHLKEQIPDDSILDLMIKD